MYISKREAIGARIRRARRAADLTQKELGAKVGCHHVTICRWEHGRGPSPRYKVLEAIAKACRISLMELVQ